MAPQTNYILAGNGRSALFNGQDESGLIDYLVKEPSVTTVRTTASYQETTDAVLMRMLINNFDPCEYAATMKYQEIEAYGCTARTDQLHSAITTMAKSDIMCLVTSDCNLQILAINAFLDKVPHKVLVLLIPKHADSAPFTRATADKIIASKRIVFLKYSYDNIARLNGVTYTTIKRHAPTNCTADIRFLYTSLQAEDVRASKYDTPSLKTVLVDADQNKNITSIVSYLSGVGRSQSLELMLKSTDYQKPLSAQSWTPSGSSESKLWRKDASQPQLPSAAPNQSSTTPPPPRTSDLDSQTLSDAKQGASRVGDASQTQLPPAAPNQSSATPPPPPRTNDLNPQTLSDAKQGASRVGDTSPNQTPPAASSQNRAQFSPPPRNYGRDTRTPSDSLQWRNRTPGNQTPRTPYVQPGGRNPRRNNPNSQYPPRSNGASSRRGNPRGRPAPTTTEYQTRNLANTTTPKTPTNSSQHP